MKYNTEIITRCRPMIINILCMLALLVFALNAMACDGCDCGDGNFDNGHCCKSNGDCKSDWCDVGICEAQPPPNCSTSFCGCQSISCAPTHDGYYCTGANTSCTVSAGIAESCGQWCTTYSSTCSNAKGQNGESECGTLQ